ncbi:MAG: TatD family hydrolase [Treponema sp.]|nr:TatD family hydrolase [Treponema sp.]
MTFCDAHLHAACCDWKANDGFLAASCAHSIEEFYRQEELVKESGNSLAPMFGMHPQMPLTQNADFMEELLKSSRIIGIGETGFDLFTSGFKAQLAAQEQAWGISLELAARYAVPVLVHDRKALDFIFRDANKLKALPAVIFHSFAFGPREAFSILRHGINAYFSFSKQILNGNKKSRACVSEIALDRLLLETDAPYQTLKGEKATSPGEIQRVYAEAAVIRGIEQEVLADALMDNFKAAYSYPRT